MKDTIMSERTMTIKKIGKVRLLERTQSPHANTKKSAKERALAAGSINRELVRFGYVMTKELTEAVADLSLGHQAEFRSDLIESVAGLTGADVNYMAMYPNFPEQVMAASDFELFMNSIAHYWTRGEWLPSYPIEKRSRYKEPISLIQIGLASDDDFYGVFKQIVSSNDSISEEDKLIVKWYMITGNDRDYPERVPFRENAAVVAGEMIKVGRPVPKSFLTGANDVLRIASYLSDGDVSLTDNVKFKSQPRRVRKALISLIDEINDIDMMIKHRERWTRLFHSLHVGEHARRFERAAIIANMFRGDGKLESHASIVETAISQEDWAKAAAYLQSRPGDFLRRFDKLARGDSELSLIGLQSVVDKVTTRLLTSMSGYVKSRKNDLGRRIVMGKGPDSKPLMLPARKPLDVGVVGAAGLILSDALSRRFQKMPPLGRVWIDPALYSCPLPTQMRSASTGKLSAARGTRFPVAGKDGTNTIRLFIYWVGQDIDLSASFHDKDFKLREFVSWTNLRAGKCYHSGDIVRAPNGAAEFIDVDIPWAKSKEHRYVAMSVRVFSGPTFGEHEKCYAGWMMRKEPNSNEIFDPSTVVQKVDLTQKAMTMIPVVFDLATREVIWIDVVGDSHSFEARRSREIGNSIEANRGNMADMVKFSATMSNRKMTIGELLHAHATARGEIIGDKRKADVKFDLSLAFDVNRVNSEFME